MDETTILGLRKIFSEQEFYEINDAISETMKRMVNTGISDEENERGSAAYLLSAWKKVVFAIMEQGKSFEETTNQSWFSEYEEKIKTLEVNKGRVNS